MVMIEAERTSKERAQYQLLHASEDDLHQASFFAAHLLKKGWHSEEWERRGTTYLQQAAFTTALVVAYARPFTQTKSGVKLPDRIRSGFSADQKALHHRIMQLRNELYAHTDVPKRGIRPLSIDGYPTAIEYRPSMRLSQEDVCRLQVMIQQVRVAIAQKKAQLIRTVSIGDYGMPEQPRWPRSKIEAERKTMARKRGAGVAR